MQSDKDNWLVNSSGSLRAVSNFFHSLQYTATKYWLHNFKKFACRKMINCILKIIPEIKSVICLNPLLDFHTHQCCLYYDGKKTLKKPTLYSYLAWIWHTVRSAVKRNFWFILIPICKNHSWAIWPFEQGWYIFIPETHPHFFLSICNLKLGQHCSFKIIFKLIGKECEISKISCFYHYTAQHKCHNFFSYSEKGDLRPVQCIFIILFLNLCLWIWVSFTERVTNRKKTPTQK